MLVVRFVSLVEGVIDALFEDFLRILRLMRMLRPWFRVRKAKISQKGSEVASVPRKASPANCC